MTLAEKVLRAKQDYDDVFEFGKSQGCYAFMDAYQDYGNRRDYAGAFMGVGWTEEILKPNYDIKPTTAYMMFRNFGYPLDLVELAEKQGINIDFSECREFNYAFSNGRVKRVGVIDTTGSRGILGGIFQAARELETVEKLIFPSTLSGSISNGAFANCDSLRNLTIEGEITVSGLDLHYSTLLTAESYHSIITHLSATATGKTLTLPPYETVKATYDTVYGEGAWDAIVAEKSNWTIEYN